MPSQQFFGLFDALRVGRTCGHGPGINRKQITPCWHDVTNATTAREDDQKDPKSSYGILHCGTSGQCAIDLMLRDVAWARAAGAAGAAGSAGAEPFSGEAPVRTTMTSMESFEDVPRAKGMRLCQWHLSVG